MEGQRGKLPSGALCLLVVLAGILAGAEGLVLPPASLVGLDKEVGIQYRRW